MSLIYLTLKEIKGNKGKYILSITTILMAVFLLNIVLTLSDGFHNKMLSEMKISGEDVLTIAFGDSENTLNYKYLPFLKEDHINKVSTISSIENIHGVKGQYINTISTVDDRKLISNVIMGVEEAYLNNLDVNIEEGKFPVDDNEVIIGAAIKKSGDLKLNDILVINIANDINVEVEVVGIIEEQEAQSFSSLPTEINQMIALKKDSEYLSQSDYMFISAIAKDTNILGDIAYDIETLLNNDSYLKKSLSGTGYKVVVVSRKDVVDMLGQWFSYIDLFILILGILVCVICTINIINIMVITINQKIKSIAIMKIVGSSDLQIQGIYIIQSGIIGFIGSILGIILGWIISNIVAGFIGWEINLKASSILISLALGLLTAVISGVIASKKVATIDTNEALIQE